MGPFLLSNGQFVVSLSALTGATGVALGLGWMRWRGHRSLAEECERNRLQVQAIVDQLREGVSVLDRKRDIVTSNRAAAMLEGRDPNVLSRAEIDKSFEFQTADGEPLKAEEWPSALGFAGTFLEDEEMNLHRKMDGRTFRVEVSTAPLLNAAGETEQVLVSYRDVTRPKQMDEALLRLAAIVESSEDAIIGKDAHGIVMSWNRAAERIFGYSSAEMIGQSIKKVLPEDRLSEEEDILARIRKGETVDHIETVRKTKSGREIEISLTVSPIRDSRGRVVGASKIVRDITERKKLEHQLMQSQKMDAIGRLTGGIAHDFNNLLGIVIGSLDLLERQMKDNEPALRRVGVAQKAAARGATLTGRLLAVSMGEDLRPKAVSLNHIIRNTLDLAARALGPDITIALELAEPMLPALADLTGVESALLNLVVNARDAMPHGGVLTLSSKVVEVEKSADMKAGRYAFVSVSDTGDGMSAEVAQRAFEPFFTTKPRGKGTGLGLAMVYGFFKQSGGSVRIYSEVGFGTTVSFYLPLAEKIAELSKIAVGAVCALGEGSVLVVDDEEDLLEIALVYLKEMGYAAHKARDGRCALECLRKHPEIGLMITDILMPGGMNGLELAEAAKGMNAKLKVIYSSGFPASSLSERNMLRVDEPLLRKPYPQAEFSAMVHGVMDVVRPE